MTFQAAGWDRERFTPAADAALRLRCSTQTVVNMIKDQRLVGFDRGAGTRPRWLVSTEALRERLQMERGENESRSKQLERELTRAQERIRYLEQEVEEFRRLGRQLGRALQTLTEAVQQTLEK